MFILVCGSVDLLRIYIYILN